jgi:hypothetical protein
VKEFETIIKERISLYQGWKNFDSKLSEELENIYQNPKSSTEDIPLVPPNGMLLTLHTSIVSLQ